MHRFLSGTVILDLSRFTAGPFGTQILSDLGAEVVKIETPSGGANPREALGQARFQIGGMDPPFLAVNRNKKSIMLDLARPAGLQVFYDLVKKANVVCDNFRPGVMDALKVGYDVLKEVNPSIICCSVSGYGATGPLSQRGGFDVTLAAESGVMSYIGCRDSAGTLDDPHLTVGDLLGGMYAAQAITAAVHHQYRTGEGARIDIAMYDGLLSWLVTGTYLLNFGFEYDPRYGQLWGVFRTKDEPIVICGHRSGPFKKLCRALNHEEWLTDEWFGLPEQRFQRHELLRSLVQAELLKKTKAEWMVILDQAGVPCAEINSVAEALTGRQAQARNMNVTLEHPQYGQIKVIGNPMKFVGLQDQFSAPPLAGEHTESTLIELLGYSSDKLADLRAQGIVS